MRDETIDWFISEMRELQDENIALKQELETLRGNILDTLLQKEWRDKDGNSLTGSQIQNQKLKRIAGFVSTDKVVPFMGLFSEIEDDWSQLKIGFKS